MDGGGFLRLQGLPLSTTIQDICKVFRAFKARRQHVQIVLNQQDLPTGEAFVCLVSLAAARYAIQHLNNFKVKEHRVQIFESSVEEMLARLEEEPQAESVDGVPC